MRKALSVIGAVLLLVFSVVPRAAAQGDISFIRTSDMAKAIEYFTKAIAKDEKMGDAYYWRGMSYLRESKLAEASADMQKVLDIDPTGQYAEKAKTVIDQLKDALK